MKNYTYTLNEGFNSYFKKLDEDFNSHREQLLQELEEVDPFDEYTEAAEYFNDLVQEAEEEEGWFSEPSGQGSIWSMYIYTDDDNEIKIKGSVFDRNLCNIASNAANEDDFKNKYKQYIEKHLKKNKSLEESSEIAEAVSKKASTDHKWGDKSVKSQLALPENQAKLNSFLKPGRDWKEMRKEFVDLINSLDCTDKNKKQTIMKINGVRNEGAFYSTVATYMTGIKTESVKLQEEATDSAFHVIVEYKDGVYEDTINRDFWFNVLQPALEKDDSVIHYTAEKASMVESLHESKEIPVKDLFLEYEAGGNIRKVKDCYVMTDSDTIEDRSQSPARKISISKTGKSRTDTVQGEKTFSLKTAEGKGRVRIDVAALKDAYERASSK